MENMIHQIITNDNMARAYKVITINKLALNTYKSLCKTDKLLFVSDLMRNVNKDKLNNNSKVILYVTTSYIIITGDNTSAINYIKAKYYHDGFIFFKCNIKDITDKYTLDVIDSIKQDDIELHYFKLISKDRPLSLN